MVRTPDRVDVAAYSAVPGGTVWLAGVGLGLLGPIDVWVSLAVLVLVPLALSLVATPDRRGTHAAVYRYAVALSPVGAVGVLAAIPRDPGPVTALLTLPWVVVTGLAAAFGLWRLLPRGLAPAEEFLIDAGLLYLPVGAVALTAHSLGLALGYSPVIVHLTAIHYHYAGFVLPVVAGLVGRTIPDGYRRAYRIAGGVVVAGMVLIAVGITFSPAVEVVSAVAFAAGVVTFAALALGTAGRADWPVPARGLLAVAALSLVATMALAVAYAWGSYASVTLVEVDGMLATHGPINAVGFALAGLAAAYLVGPDSRTVVPDPGIPFSPLRGGIRIGADYPERTGMVAGGPREGVVDDLSVYDRPDFEADDLAPEVRSFYEATGDWDLVHETTWHRPFRAGARLALSVCARIEQLDLPRPGEAGPRRMAGRILDVDVDGDPRSGTRAWVRTDEGGDAVFVAVYGAHDHEGERYVNIAMPLPGLNLTAVLYPEPIAESDGGSGGGWRLTTRRSGPGRGDEGLYFVFPLLPVKLPVEQSFRVWPADSPSAPDAPASLADTDPEVVARHEMWLFGRQFLTIDYALRRASDGGAQTSTSTS